MKHILTNSGENLALHTTILSTLENMKITQLRNLPSDKVKVKD